MAHILSRYDKKQTKNQKQSLTGFLNIAILKTSKIVKKISKWESLFSNIVA